MEVKSELIAYKSQYMREAITNEYFSRIRDEVQDLQPSNPDGTLSMEDMGRIIADVVEGLEDPKRDGSYEDPLLDEKEL